jgi:PAS domain-containing protein
VENVVVETNERYRRLVELAPDGIFVSDGTRIVFVNPAAVRLFGATAAEQVLARSSFDLFHPDSHALIRERISKLLAGEAVQPTEGINSTLGLIFTHWAGRKQVNGHKAGERVRAGSSILARRRTGLHGIRISRCSV